MARDKSVDFSGGVLIIVMIVVHCFQWSSLTDTMLYDVIQRVFFFYMAWFFYKSGMFHKQKPLKKYLFSCFCRLLIPFMVYSIIAYPIWCVRKLMIGVADWKTYVVGPFFDLIRVGSISANEPLWFLLTLFLAQTLFALLKQLRIPSVIIALMSFVVYCVMMHNGSWGPLYITNTLAALGFVASGELICKVQYDRRLFYVSIVFCVIILIVGCPLIDIHTNAVLLGPLWLWPVACLFAIIVMNNLTRLIPEKYMMGIDSVGRDSLY